MSFRLCDATRQCVFTACVLDRIATSADSNGLPKYMSAFVS
jgi:hypothetical protein